VLCEIELLINFGKKLTPYHEKDYPTIYDDDTNNSIILSNFNYRF